MLGKGAGKGLLRLQGAGGGKITRSGGGQAFPRELRRTAVDCVYFGGELKPDKQKGFFKKRLVKMMRNDIINNGDSDDEIMIRILPEINPSEITKLAEKLKKL